MNIEKNKFKKPKNRNVSFRPISLIVNDAKTAAELTPIVLPAHINPLLIPLSLLLKVSIAKASVATSKIEVNKMTVNKHSPIDNAESSMDIKFEEIKKTKLEANNEKKIHGFLFPIFDDFKVSTNGPIKILKVQGSDANDITIAISLMPNPTDVSQSNKAKYINP